MCLIFGMGEVERKEDARVGVSHTTLERNTKERCKARGGQINSRVKSLVNVLWHSRVTAYVWFSGMSACAHAHWKDFHSRHQSTSTWKPTNAKETFYKD